MSLWFYVGHDKDDFLLRQIIKFFSGLCPVKLSRLSPVISRVGALSPCPLLAVSSAVAGSKSLSWQESPAVLQRLLRPVPDTL